MKVRGDQRFRPGHECPICGGHDHMARHAAERCWGYTTDDGQYAHCMRAEFAGALAPSESDGGYHHRLSGPCRCGLAHDGVARVPAVTTSTRSRSAAWQPWRDPAWRLAREYVYTDAHGAPLYRIQRWEQADGAAKEFRQQRYEGGRWVPGVTGTRVPYRLHELVAADPGEPVLIAEGEKCVDQLAGLGFVATTNPDGAGMGHGHWRPELTPYFTGRDCILLPDNDAPGYAHMQEVALALSCVASSVRVLCLPGLPEHGDVVDWLTRCGHTGSQLRARLARAVLFTPYPPRVELPRVRFLPSGLRTLTMPPRLARRVMATTGPDGAVIRTGTGAS